MIIFQHISKDIPQYEIPRYDKISVWTISSLISIMSREVGHQKIEKRRKKLNFYVFSHSLRAYKTSILDWKSWGTLKSKKKEK